MIYSHWTLLYAADNKNHVTWFDSMGESAPPVSVERRMDDMGRQKVYNIFDYQQYGSNSCGYWAAYAADFFRVKGDSGQSALNALKKRFSPINLRANERALYSHFH